MNGNINISNKCCHIKGEMPEIKLMKFSARIGLHSKIKIPDMMNRIFSILFSCTKNKRNAALAELQDFHDYVASRFLLIINKVEKTITCERIFFKSEYK